MTLKIISAEDVLFEGEVSKVTLPGANGSFTVLNHHASLISSLTSGEIRYEENGVELSQTVSGGMVDVDNNVVSVCIY